MAEAVLCWHSLCQRCEWVKLCVVGAGVLWWTPAAVCLLRVDSRKTHSHKGLRSKWQFLYTSPESNPHKNLLTSLDLHSNRTFKYWEPHQIMWVFNMFHHIFEDIFMNLALEPKLHILYAQTEWDHANKGCSDKW